MMRMVQISRPPAAMPTRADSSPTQATHSPFAAPQFISPKTQTPAMGTDPARPITRMFLVADSRRSRAQDRATARQ